MNNTSNQSQELLSSKDAGAILGYTHDYISRLCRQNKMSGVQKGREWYVTREELEAFKGRHEIELQEKKKELSKKFSRIRLEHEAKKREARAQSVSPVVSMKKDVQTSDMPSIQKSITFNMPKQLIALGLLAFFIFGPSIFDLLSKDIVMVRKNSLLGQVGQVSSFIDKGIQDTIYTQAAAVEPVTTAVLSLASVAEGFTLFKDSVSELPKATYISLRKIGNAYLTLYFLQGGALYESGRNMNSMGANVLWGYQLIGESIYLGGQDIIGLYARVLHVDSSFKTSQNTVNNFTANVTAGFGYAKETLEDTLLKQTTSQLLSIFNTWTQNVRLNVSAVQSDINKISHNTGAYIGSLFSINLHSKQENIKVIKIKENNF